MMATWLSRSQTLVEGRESSEVAGSWGMEREHSGQRRAEEEDDGEAFEGGEVDVVPGMMEACCGVGTSVREGW